MASAGFSSYSTTPSTSMEQLNIPPSAVNCATGNAVNKMQTIADMLLLQSDDTSAITIHPLFNTDNNFKKCKDTIIKNAKGLAATIRQINHQLRQRQYGGMCKSLEVLADQVVTVTEATAHMAYTNTIDSITLSGHHSFNRYLLVKCELDITATCEHLQFEYGSLSSEEVLKVTSEVSDHVASIKRICFEAKDLESLPPEDKVHISLLGDAISAAFMCLVNCLKTFASNPQSSEYRQKCLILAKPLLASIASLRQVTDTTLLSDVPVTLDKSAEPLTALLGSAMAIVASSVRYVESVQNVAEDMDDNSSWKTLVNCSKSVAESATLMATSLKESTPLPSRKSSFKADL